MPGFGGSPTTISEAVFATRYGAIGNGAADDTVGLQAACEAAGGKWLDLEKKTYIISSPIILPPSIAIRHGTIQLSGSYAPTLTDATNGAAVMQRQGGTATITSVDTSLNTVTLSAAHNMSQAGIQGIVFKGTPPAPLVAGRVYYYDAGTGSTLSVRATRLGSAVDITGTTTGATAHLEVNSLQKVYIYDLMIDGRDYDNPHGPNWAKGINGIALGLQQASEVRKLRVQHFLSGTGLILYGQQAHFDNLTVFNTGTGIALEDAKMMYFYTTSLEGATKAVHVRPAQVFPTSTATNCAFWGLHHESPGASDVCFDLQSGTAGLQVEGWITNMSLAGQKFLYSHTGNPATTGYTVGPGYFSSIALDGAYLIHDSDRGHALRQALSPDGPGVQRRSTERYTATPFASNTPGSYPDRYPVMYLRQGGGFIGMGAQNDGVESMALQPGSAQTGDLQQWKNSSGATVTSINSSGAFVPAADLSLNSKKITNLAAPTASTDAATKAYADSIAAGLDPHASVRVATTANITLSGTQTIDGVAVVALDRVLVKNQTTTSANGIYVCAAGAWSRSTDADTGAELTGGTFTFVELGTVHADQGWVATHNGTPTLGTDPITFTQFTGAPSASAIPSGTASPEGVVVGTRGDLYLQKDTTTGTSTAGGATKLWMKIGAADDATSTGWKAFMSKEHSTGSTGFRRIYVSNAGRDDADGLSPGSAKKTITAALTIDNPPKEIFVAPGKYVETVTVSKPGTVIRGVGSGLTGPVVKAPSSSANCINITGDAVRIEGVATEGADGTWTGRGWNIHDCAHIHLCDIAHIGPATTVNDTSGGTGLYMEWGEGHYIERLSVSQANLAVHTSTECSQGVFENVQTDTCYRDLLMDTSDINWSAGGGFTFIKWKSTNAIGTGFDGLPRAPYLVEIGGETSGGTNTFIGFDAEETGGVNKVKVISDDNLFINCISAPQTNWEIYSDNNQFINFAHLGAVFTVFGKNNVFSNMRSHSTGAAPQVIDSGINNQFVGNVPAKLGPGRTTRKEVLAPAFYRSGYTVGPASSAAAVPGAPAKWISLMDPDTGQTLRVPGFLPPASPVVDSFVRANSTTTPGTADSGQVWTESGFWGINSNQLYVSSFSSVSLTWLESGIADGIVEVDLMILPDSTNHGGLAFRLTDANNHWRLYTTGAGGATLRKIVAGVGTTVSNPSISPAFAAGDHMKVILSGSTIAVEINGVVKIVATDTFNETATKHGAYTNDTICRWKNFRVTA